MASLQPLPMHDLPHVNVVFVAVLQSFSRHFCSGSLALASLNLACRNPVPTFPQRSPPSLLTTAACGGLRSTPDCRPRRTSLHLSYSCAAPCGPAILVTQDPSRSSAGKFAVMHNIAPSFNDVVACGPQP